MRNIAITLILISLTGVGLFAEGSQEETTWEPGMGRTYSSDDQSNWGPETMGRRNSDQSNWNRGQMQGRPGYAGNSQKNWDLNVEELTITGIIDLTDVNTPKLTAGEQSYELMIPYRLDYDIEITNGDEITISGFEVPAFRRSTDSVLPNLMVTGAIFNGKEYDLAPEGMIPGAGMRNSGPMNGRPQGRSNKGGYYSNSNNRVPRSQGMWNCTNQRPFRR
jgi:hypothetical protein